MVTFTEYRTSVLKHVHKTKDPKVFPKYHWFSTTTLTNIIADNWKDSVPQKVSAENVVAYIETLEGATA